MYKTFCGWLVNTTWKYFFWEYLNAFFFSLPPSLIEMFKMCIEKSPFHIETFFFPPFMVWDQRKKLFSRLLYYSLYTFFLEFWMIKIITYLLVKVSNFIIFPAGFQFSLKICLHGSNFWLWFYLSGLLYEGML